MKAFPKSLIENRRDSAILPQVASVALAVEALESILVEQGVLREGQLMEKIKKLAEEKIMTRQNP